MPAEIVLQQTVSALEVVRLREQLANARDAVAKRSKNLERLRTDLKLFENRYFSEVGVLYAEFDLLEAHIAEREIDLYDSAASRSRAAEARQRAENSRDAASEYAADAPLFDPPAALRKLFREVAKRIHPDTANDDEESKYFTLLMARANLAYRQGDTDALQRMLEDHSAPDAAGADGGSAAELARLTRQVQRAKRDLAAIVAEQQAIEGSEIALLHLDAAEAALAQRDLLSELAAKIRDQIEDARRRLELIDRQISAHGR